MKKDEWIGSYKIGQLLSQYSMSAPPLPPQSSGVYVISRKPWRDNPTKRCVPLYAGSNTGETNRLRSRIGQLIIRLLDLVRYESVKHSGGRTINEYCRKNHLLPMSLYIGWNIGGCARCMENKTYDELRPLFNKRRPPQCKRHKRRGQ